MKNMNSNQTIYILINEAMSECIKIGEIRRKKFINSSNLKCSATLIAARNALKLQKLYD